MLNWNPPRTKTMIKRFSRIDFYKIGDPLYANPLSPFPNFDSGKERHTELLNLTQEQTLVMV